MDFTERLDRLVKYAKEIAKWYKESGDPDFANSVDNVLGHLENIRKAFKHGDPARAMDHVSNVVGSLDSIQTSFKQTGNPEIATRWQELTQEVRELYAYLG
uniref:De novo designed protein 0515 n=1 Tax=synthetic construct TaxID=32630 RepID=UPI001E281D30|nr:Chain A, De novo designed protein 0515 [synthetic construct]